uniref:Ribosomal protein S7 n=1 Tax=Gloeochaete wittrockiana TaxID=38269 RepID=A0A096Y6T9_9EUKA|nr:ribosomal protein S7 [Gloeochaete wittrockiana]AIM52032.1 ribosomal protein S7 [Gloeochaete wittrockiana]
MLIHSKNYIFRKGEKEKVEKVIIKSKSIFFDMHALNIVPITYTSFKNIRPSINVKKTRIGNKIISTPYILTVKQQKSLFFKWILEETKTNLKLKDLLINQLKFIFYKQGNIVKKLEKLYKDVEQSRSQFKQKK